MFNQDLMVTFVTSCLIISVADEDSAEFIPQPRSSGTTVAAGLYWKVMMRIEGLQYVFLEKYPTSNQPNPAKQLDITASSL